MGGANMRAKIIRTIGISLMMLLIGGSIAWAGRNPCNNYRNQQVRIRQGVASGEITGWELQRLKKEQARIHAARRNAVSDGWITCREKRHLQRMRGRASRHIYFARHNSCEARHPWKCRKHHAPCRSCYPAPGNDWFYFSGHIAQPGWGFGWSTGGDLR